VIGRDSKAEIGQLIARKKDLAEAEYEAQLGETVYRIGQGESSNQAGSSFADGIAVHTPLACSLRSTPERAYEEVRHDLHDLQDDNGNPQAGYFIPSSC
jgi:hypothetical protein